MFVRGGWVYPGNSLGNAGNSGYYWSSVGYDSDIAYRLHFDPSWVGPSRNYRRYAGQSLRCVALGG